jgi:predicted DNA-binding protein (UPF0278 family)
MSGCYRALALQQWRVCGLRACQSTERARWRWIQRISLEETEKAFNRLILQITDAIIMPEKVDVKETLERGRQVAEQDIWEGR